MKNTLYKSLLILALLFSFSCEDYLDKAPESTLTMEEVFKDFDHAQGFVEEMYALIVDYGLAGHTLQDYIFGDDGIINNSWSASVNIDQGNLNFVNSQSWDYLTNHWEKIDTNDPHHRYRPGIMTGSTWGIRKANMVIENIDLMVDATQEEKDVILGQAYFFRAFFHHEIMKFWGRYPYIDKVLKDDYKLPRPATYKESALKANEDFIKAANLLPVSWDTKSYGQKTLGSNKGRINKGAVYALQGKNLLLAASPLMKGSTDTYDYDKELCEMAVNAFAEVLKLDEQGVYDLVPFDKYEEVFWKVNIPYTWAGSTEYIFNAPSGDHGWTRWLAIMGMDAQVHGSHPELISPTHNFIYNNFGMANGLSIEDDLSGKYGKPTYDPGKPFKNRDPRFYKWLTIDGDTLVTNPQAGEHRTAKLYTGGLHRSAASGSRTGYFYKKFYPTMHSKWNNIMLSATPTHLHMRLTDVYLMYAEALHAAKNSATATPNSYKLSAEQAINIIRDRAGIPHVHPSIVGNPVKFMDELRRERSVELAYEAHRWVDIRRWVLAHLDKYKTKTGLDFPKDHSYFNEFVLVTRLCEYPKHYWLPFKSGQTQLYEGFPQNPGW